MSDIYIYIIYIYYFIYSCTSNYIIFVGCPEKGVWSDTEDEQLTEAVRETAGDRYLELDHPQINWPKIAEKVPRRNTDQCYSHW